MPETGEMMPEHVARYVRQLPRQTVAALAEGPTQEWDEQHGFQRCHACRVLTKVNCANAASTLLRWHSQLVQGRPGYGREQDPTRAGMIYGAAAALLLTEVDDV